MNPLIIENKEFVALLFTSAVGMERKIAVTIRIKENSP